MAMALSAASLFAGCLWAMARAAGPGVWEWGCLLAALISALVLRNANWRRIIAFFALGFLVCHGEISRYLEMRLVEGDAGREYVIEGVVRGAVTAREHGYSFAMEIDQWLNEDGAQWRGPPTLFVRWYQTEAEPRPGDAIKALVRIKPPINRRSGAGFDAESYSLINKRHGSGYIRRLIAHERGGALDWRARIEGLRFGLSARIAGLAGAPEAKAIVNGLANGDRRAISNDLWQLLNRTGTSHLMAISGMHVGMFALCVWRLLLALAVIFPRPLPLSRQAPLALATLGITWLYALFCGMSLPTQRALLMLAAFLLSQLLARQRSSPRALALAFILVVLWQPTAIASAGLWLSFGAVAFLLAGIAMSRGAHFLWRWVYLQAGISLFLLPLCLYWFGQSALAANAANAVAIPLVCFVILPLVWLATLADALWAAAGETLFSWALAASEALLHTLEWALALPAPYIAIDSPSPAALVLSWLGVSLVFLAPLPTIKALGLALCLPLIADRGPPAIAEGAVRISMIDVGQGLAMAVRTRERILLYDTGPGYGASGSAGGRIVAPWLEKRGISRLDRIIVSHLDNDHSGGLADILKRLPTGAVLSSDIAGIERVLAKGAAPAVPKLPCRAGARWRWNGVDFEVLWPSREWKGRNRNDSSCVLWVRTKGLSALFLGDIGARIEQRLVRLYPDLRADIIIIPHHGSAYSTDPQLLAHTGARVALISAGYLNRWRMPAEQVLDRLRQAGLFWLSTANQGTLSLSLDGKNIRIASASDRAKRYWHSLRRPEPVPCQGGIVYPLCTKSSQPADGWRGS